MTFYFYDLETSGIDARTSRIMQFAGQRVDENLQIVGEPHNILVKLTDDILPEPDAIMVTGITPQKTMQEGVTELELLNVLNKEVFTPETVVCGFNSIRFDDEFMRYTLYRNLFDPYEREWADNRSRWDLIDVVRMMRALRPEGINWPVDSEGKGTNRLEKLSEANNLEHDNAHDALSDVIATIELAKLIKSHQPKLFNHLLNMRLKKNVLELLSVDNPQPIVHSTGKFSSEFEKTSVVYPIAKHPTNPNAILVFDLRFSPSKFADLGPRDLAELAFTPWRDLEKQGKTRLPVKAIHVNKSPAIAPLGVLDEKSQERIKLTIAQINAHLDELKKAKEFAGNLEKAWNNQELPNSTEVEAQLYDGFMNDSDKDKINSLHSMDTKKIKDYEPKFSDERLNKLYPRFKARNFPEILNQEERNAWEAYRADRLTKSGNMTFQKYTNRLAQLAEQYRGDSGKTFLLEELQLWAESIAPFETQELL